MQLPDDIQATLVEVARRILARLPEGEAMCTGCRRFYVVADGRPCDCEAPVYYGSAGRVEAA